MGFLGPKNAKRFLGLCSSCAPPEFCLLHTPSKAHIKRVTSNCLLKEVVSVFEKINRNASIELLCFALKSTYKTFLYGCSIQILHLGL